MVFLLLTIMAGAAIAIFIAIVKPKYDKLKVKLAEQEQLTARYKKAYRKYKPIVDIEKELARQRKVQAKVIQECDELKDDARKAYKVIVNKANVEANDIVTKAHEEAICIGKEAEEARSQLGHYKSSLRAIRNTINGYGDEYLIPSSDALDDVAEEWSHKEAGQMLKEARAQTRLMVKDGQAAACDYAEQDRCQRAKQFVTDAFNGHVDSILTKVKHDNYGKLAAQIRDAFSTVNLNGEAFRNARIQNDYLAARLNELRWAVAVNELKIQEREEQRELREQIREEEKARKEFEKAQKEAEKAEREIEQKMRDAEQRLKLDMAETEREKLLAEIEGLKTDLKVAEENGQRAMSMAQQTKRGHVYVISNIGSFGENVYKIGLTRRLDPMDRVKELGDASVPFPFDVHAMLFHEDAPGLEKTLHTHFNERQLNKANPRKEFFRASLSEIRQEVEAMGLQAKWTLRAEAAEYRESLAIEKEERGEVMPDGEVEDFEFSQDELVSNETGAS